MDIINFIKEVETNNNMTAIKVNNIEVWPFLRSTYFFTYGRNHDFDLPDGQIEKPSSIKIRRLKNIFYGLPNLFNKYDYFIFSNVREIRMIKNIYVNKLADHIMTVLGKEKVLLIESPGNGSHFDQSKISVDHIISSELFLFTCYLPVLKKNLKIENEKILKNVNKKYNLNVDYHKLIFRFVCYKNLFKLFLKMYRPKLIFITNYYNILHQALIYSAKKLQIPVIELQHGIINPKHPAYNIFTRLDNSFFPDFLFAFGNHTKMVFNQDNYFIKKENIIPIGNIYIDYINNDYKASKSTKIMFKKFRKKYNKIVAVASQWTIEKKLIKFLKKCAALDKNILYIFIPRDLNKDYSLANFPSNIVILKDLNFYQIIKESDFHATVYSTTAVEAPALGVPNMLINIDGFAEKYYSTVLTNHTTTRFVESEEEFVKVLQKYKIINKQRIMSAHEGFYKQDHKKNIQRAINFLEGKKK